MRPSSIFPCPFYRFFLLPFKFSNHWMDSLWIASVMQECHFWKVISTDRLVSISAYRIWLKLIDLICSESSCIVKEPRRKETREKKWKWKISYRAKISVDVLISGSRLEHVEYQCMYPDTSGRQEKQQWWGFYFSRPPFFHLSLLLSSRSPSLISLPFALICMAMWQVGFRTGSPAVAASSIEPLA